MQSTAQYILLVSFWGQCVGQTSRSAFFSREDDEAKGVRKKGILYIVSPFAFVSYSNRRMELNFTLT